LNDEICNWFLQEIHYLEKKIHLSEIPLQEQAEFNKSKANQEKPKQKVLCVLSTDQTGLILRASDELRILVAKSMSEVFKTIVPHLSTPYKEDLSYDGMRSKSYVAEERDKLIAIETLERIIRKIKEY
jgi:predicted metal-dependent hydrolase